jgi:hypothetical protein
MMSSTRLLCCFFALPCLLALQQGHNDVSRRSWFHQTLALPIGVVFAIGSQHPLLLAPLSADAAELQFTTCKSGMQWSDAKVGSGSTKQVGDIVAVDYVLSTTGARYGSKIYSTAEKNTPYRWTLGDGSTIAGLEQAVIGGEGIPPMMPGGIRRIIVPSQLAYESLARKRVNCEAGKGVGPIPPNPEAFEEYQRFKNIYCNPNRQYQPDVVMDIKMYGKRAETR